MESLLERLDLLHDERLEGFAHAPSVCSIGKCAALGRSSNRRFSGRTPDRASASRRLSASRGGVVSSFAPTTTSALNGFLKSSPKSSFAHSLGISRRSRAPSPPKPPSPARNSCSSPTSHPLGARGAHVRVAGFAVQVAVRRAALHGGGLAAHRAAHDVQPGPVLRDEEAEPREPKRAVRGSLSPPPLFFSSPFFSFRTHQRPRPRARPPRTRRARSRAAPRTAAGRAKPRPAPRARPRSGPATPRARTPSADITFKVSSAAPSALYTRWNDSGLVWRRRRARRQAVRRTVYGDRAHVRLRRDARKQVPERIRRAVRAVHAHQGVDVFVRARRRPAEEGGRRLFVVHADGHAVHLDGDELGVRVRERRGGDEALERFRVRIGEGLHHELVEVLLDLRAPGVEQRPNEVREQIVFRRARNRRSTRTAGRRARARRIAPRREARASSASRHSDDAGSTLRCPRREASRACRWTRACVMMMPRLSTWRRLCKRVRQVSVRGAPTTCSKHFFGCRDPRGVQRRGRGVRCPRVPSRGCRG